MWHEPLIRSVSVLYGADSLVSPGCSLLVIVLAKQQHAPPSAIGAIFSIGAVGGVVGSTITGWTRRWFTFSQTVIGVRWAIALLWPLYALTHSIIGLGLVTAAIYLLNPVINVAGMSYSVPSIPEALRARVGSVFQLIPSAVTPIRTCTDRSTAPIVWSHYCRAQRQRLPLVHGDLDHVEYSHPKCPADTALIGRA
jgi:hypothetical protein